MPTSTFRLLLSLVSSAGFLLSSSFSYGQTTDDADEPVVLSEFVVSTDGDLDYRATSSLTATRVSTKLIDTPLNIQVVTEQFLDDLNVDRIGEALRYTSGAMEDTFFGDDGHIRIRGQEIGSPFRNGYRRRRSIGLENIERVEVIKGPASVLFGQGNPGGVVNYTTKKPEFTNATKVKLKYGSDSYFKGVLDTQFAVSDNFGVRIIGAQEDSEDWRDFEQTEMQYLNVVMRARLGDKAEFLIEREFRRSRANDALEYPAYNPQFLADYATPPQDVINQFRTASRSTDQDVINYLQGRWRLNEARWAGDVQTTRGEFNRPWRATEHGLSLHPSGAGMNLGGPDLFQVRDGDSFTAELTFAPTDWLSGRVGYNWFDSYYDEYNIPSRVTGDGLLNLSLARGRPFANVDKTLQGDLVASFTTGDIEHKLLFGAEKTETESVSYRYTVDYNQAAPVPDGNGGTLTGINIFRNYNPFTQTAVNLNEIFTDLNETGSGAAETKGYYITHQTTLMDGRVHTMLGARRVEFESDLDKVSETVFSSGLTFRVVDGVVLFGSYSENFIPTINLSASGPGALPGEIVQLPTESAAGWDVGIKTDWQENKLSGSVSFFELERQNITRNAVEKREADPRNNDADPNNDVFFRSASGLERSRGMELDLTWSPTRNYQALVAYSYLWEAKLVSDPNYVPGTLFHSIQIGRRLRTAPEHTFSFFNRYKFTDGALKGFSIGAGGRYIGEHGPLNHSPQFNIINDSSLLFDAFIKYKTKLFDRDTEIQLNIENVTDDFYIIGNRSSGDPRKFYLTATMFF